MTGDNYNRVMKKWDALAKPIDGLGELEQLVARIGAIQRTENPRIDRRTLLVFLADNGIVAEGVSQSDSGVTRSVAEAMVRDESTVCVMARQARVLVHPVDIGMSGEPVAGMEYRRIGDGTRDFAIEPAMTQAETMAAINTGRDLVGEIADSLDILLLGEMGIGNTSTSTALSCALLSISPDEVVGHGAGLPEDMVAHKRQVLSEALKKYGYDKVSDVNPIEALATLGGYDIAGMVGAIIEASARHIPVVLDGLITFSAALTAEKICRSNSRQTVNTSIDSICDTCIASHFPREPMGQRIIAELALNKPPIDASLALGEGTGGVLLVPLLDVCMNLYNHGTRFEGLGIEAYERYL